MEKIEGDEPILNQGRRSFLRTAGVAAAAGLALSETRLFAAPVDGQGNVALNAVPGPLFTADALHADITALEAAPGNKSLWDGKNFTVVLTTETAKAGKEFEWHEGRDHIFQILEGSMVYEVGGTPKNGRNTRPGEWLAPESEGAVTYALKKGDMLVIPRGTPHRRNTAGSVTLMLISPMGSVQG